MKLTTTLLHLPITDRALTDQLLQLLLSTAQPS